MTDIRYVRGDATAPEGTGLKLIAHVCNDEGAWGAGFVLALSKRWDKPEREYRLWYNRWRQNEAVGLPFGLGAVQLVSVGPGLAVLNMVAQRGLAQRGGLPPIRYDALRTCLSRVAEAVRLMGETPVSIHMPRIGCGLAGGRWELVEKIVREELCAKEVEVTVYDL